MATLSVMRLAPIVSRLQDQCPALRQVIHALSGAVPTSYPAAYVLPLGEQARGDEGGETVIVARHGVEIMVKHAAMAASGGPAHEALEDVRSEVLAALQHWLPAGATQACAFAAGKLLRFEPALAVWRDEFTFAYPLSLDAAMTGGQPADFTTVHVDYDAAPHSPEHHATWADEDHTVAPDAEDSISLSQ